jgi:hypothetical protein
MRCYFLAKGHIVAVEVLTAELDADAIKQAEGLFQERAGRIVGFEVWDRGRFVYRYPDGEDG